MTIRHNSYLPSEVFSLLLIQPTNALYPTVASIADNRGPEYFDRTNFPSKPD